MAAHLRQVNKLKHHEQAEICTTRAKYRQGRKQTAVRVYTVNQESKYLIVQGVPAVGANQELLALCSEFGEVAELKALDDFPTEDYTEAYSVKYQMIKNARFAKKKLDERSFFGGCLHVCYAPEFETVDDTREKLQERRRIIAAKTNDCKYETQSKVTDSLDSHKEEPQKSNVEVEDNEQAAALPPEPMTYIWAGKTYTMENVNQSGETSNNVSATKKNDPNISTNISFIPRQLKRPTSHSTGFDLHSSVGEDQTTHSIRAALNNVREPRLDVTLKKRKVH